MKKMIIAVAIALCFLSYRNYGQAPNWLWANSAIGNGIESECRVAIDSMGNSYQFGSFYSTSISFGSYTLNNTDISGTSTDIYIVKYDDNGIVLWARKAGGLGDQNSTSITVDKYGNIYIAGVYDSPMMAIGSFSLINAGASDIFLAKYDKNGNILWAKSEGGIGNDLVSSIVTDKYGNIIIAGIFESNTITFGSTILSNNGIIDIFITQYDSIGNVNWAKSAGSFAEDYATSIALDTAAYIYVTGTFYSSSLAFGSTILTNLDPSGNSPDIFLAKFDSGGNIIWAKSAGGTDFDEASFISVDNSGNSHITGDFYSPSISFGTITLNNAGNSDLFIAKYDTNGSVLWAKRAGGVYSDQTYSVAVDNYDNSYLAGSFSSPTISFGLNTLINAGDNDLFVAKYDVNGNEFWAKSEGGIVIDEATSIAVSSTGEISIVGHFMSFTLQFGSFTLTNSGDFDVFIAKLSSSNGIDELNNPSTISLFPNPATSTLQISLPGKSTIQILNLQGQTIKTLTATESLTNIDISALARGMYYVKVRTEKDVAVRKFVKE